MRYDERTWVVELRSDLDQLARDLNTKHFSLRQAFQTAGGTIWANISYTNEEECPQEYAVLRPAGERFYHHVQTVVVTWCSATRLMRYLRLADQGEFNTLFELGSIAIERMEFEPPH